jgi:hypothetical protein
LGAKPKTYSKLGRKCNKFSARQKCARENLNQEDGRKANISIKMLNEAELSTKTL